MTRTEQAYTYQSAPHAAPRALFSQSVPLTLMSDPRVVRGSTQVLAKKAAIARQAESEQSKQLEKQKEEEQRKIQARASIHPPPTQPHYDYKVKPFAADDLEVERYLIAEDDLPPRMRDHSTHMDALLDRPPTPKYIPRKTGVDAHTQVDDVRELFNFDIEVTPMLEIIVQKTLEQSIYEVNTEEEINQLHYQADLHSAELVREQEWIMEQVEKLKKDKEGQEQKRKEILQRKQRETNLKTTIGGMQMMRQIVPHMIDNIADEQYKKGLWKQGDLPVWERSTWPALLREIDNNRDCYYAAQQVVDDLLFGAEELYVRLTHSENLGGSEQQVCNECGDGDCGVGAAVVHQVEVKGEAHEDGAGNREETEES